MTVMENNNNNKSNMAYTPLRNTKLGHRTKHVLSPCQMKTIDTVISTDTIICCKLTSKALLLSCISYQKLFFITFLPIRVK